MTKTNYIIVCDNAFVSKENGSLCIIEIFDKINSPGFPAIHPRFAVVTNLSGTVGHHDHRIEIISSNSGEVISFVEGKFVIEREGQKAQFIGYFKNVIFPTPGEYKIKVINDGEPQETEEQIYVES